MIKEFVELDFRVRCCKNFTPKEAQRMVYLTNGINKLNPPQNTFALLMQRNDKRADEARDLLYGRDEYLDKAKAKASGKMRPLQTKEQKKQARLDRCRSGRV